MAIKNIPLAEMPDFGRRLMELAIGKEVEEPKKLAVALYGKCKELIEPAQRKNKYGKSVKNYDHDISAITRTIQKHFSEQNAFEVQSKYLYAYSIFFDCSLDYLFGVTSVKSCDIEIRTICDKIHLNEQAVNNLIEEYDSDTDVFSPTRCWADVLSSSLFVDIPYAWLHYCMSVFYDESVAKKIEEIKNAEKFVTDPVYRMMMETQCESLGKINSRTSLDCDGAFRRVMGMISKYIDQKTDEYVNSKFEVLPETFYEAEIKKSEKYEELLKECLGLQKKESILK